MASEISSFRNPAIDGPIVASDDWYASSDRVLDGAATEAAQEWSELLALLKNQGGASMDRGRLKAALARGGVPMHMRAQVWLAFSGAGERQAQQPHIYEQLCQRVAAYHEARSHGRRQTPESSSTQTKACTQNYHV